MSLVPSHSATAVAAVVANGGGVGIVDPAGEPRIPGHRDLLSMLSSAIAPGSSMGVRSFTEMVAASVGAGFVAGRGARRAAQRAATAAGVSAVPTTRDTPSSSAGFAVPSTRETPSPSSAGFAVPPTNETLRSSSVGFNPPAMLGVPAAGRLPSPNSSFHVAPSG